jgi:lipid II:glycine glycyltransferase (peptidoglycan interpeptide bridge formation enzyme)
MSDRNKMNVHYSIRDLISIKNNLPPFGSLNLFLSMFDKTILSGRIIGVIGKKAYDLLAAVTYEGRKRYSSHFLIWGIINWCKERNIEYLDMSGVDPFWHKGIFNFKKGIGGNFIEHIGEWELSNNWFLRLMVNLCILKFLKD